MNMKITVIICALAYFTVISGTPCGNHKREASDEHESGHGSGGSSGTHFPGQEQFQQITNLISGGNHNSNENEEHKTESSIPFLPDSISNQINQFKPHNRGKREESAEKPSEESSQNPFISQLPESIQKPVNQISNIFKPDQLQQIGGMFGGGDKEEEHHS
uniref:Putative secreted protein n=1 Tax=Panstrongylus lignarius TaxID=156445 RepID=A0A224XV89_9HEMI